MAHLCRYFLQKKIMVRECGRPSLHRWSILSEGPSLFRRSLAGWNSCMGTPETSPYHAKYPHVSCSMIFCNFFFLILTPRLGTSSVVWCRCVCLTRVISCCPYSPILPTARLGWRRTGTKKDSALEGCGVVRVSKERHDESLRRRTHQGSL